MMGSTLDSLPDNSAAVLDLEALEEEVDFLKSIIKLHSEQIAELKKAQ